MVRLRILSGEEICKILQDHGFARVRQKGSHIIMQKKTKESTTTVPVPNHKEIKHGTLKSIMRQSSIKSSEFEK